MSLHVATRYCHGAVLQLLLERGADLNARNSVDQTARDLACANGLTDVVQAFE
jgi:ankyrin repeat protein